MPDVLDAPLCVVPRVRVATVHAPGIAASTCGDRSCTVHTSDWRALLGSPRNTHAVVARPTTTLRELFERRHPRESLVTGYVLMRDGVVLGECPRIAKDALVWLRAEGYDVVTRNFIADVDTPGHVPWTPTTREVWDHVWNTAPSLQTCAGYLSTRGARAIQPLDRFYPVDEVEPRLRAWLEQLVREGVWTSVLECKDWTHLMRVPSRDAPWVSVERVATIEPPPPVTVMRARTPRRVRASAAAPAAGLVLSAGAAIPPGSVTLHDATDSTANASTTSSTPAVTFTDAVPSGWEPVADALGAAIQRSVRASWRRCYLALSGALISRGCPTEGVPAVIARAHAVDQSYPEWQALLADRITIARDTVVKHGQRVPVLGYTALREEFPAVADALDQTTTSGAEARVLAQLAAAGPKPIAVGDAVAQIERELRDAWGVVLIAAPPGTGKTQATTRHAATLPPIGERAAPGSRLAVSAPTHKLAQQTAAKLPKSLRLFSPPSLLGPDGEPVCIYADAAYGLAAGGQSVGREFCEGRGKAPCELARTCPARLGMEGDPRANLVTSVHGLVRPLREYAGSQGLLVVDEPGEIVTTESITLDDLDTACRYLDSFVPRYVAKITPALTAFDAWVRTMGSAETESLTSLPDAIRAAASAIDPEALALAGIPMDTASEDLGDAVLLAVAEAIDPKAQTPAPPILWRAVAQCRPNPGRAVELGRASRVLLLLRRGLVAATPHSVRIDTRSGERLAALTGVNEDFAAALAHEGPVVVLDANAALHAPAITKHLGSPPRLVELMVRDGAPITRTILVTGAATRTTWLPRGMPDWDAIVPALRAMVALVLEHPEIRQLGIIAPQAIEAAIMHTLRPEAPAPIEAWGRPRKALSAARERLAPVLAPLATLEVSSGHFFALEGLDFMAGFDATVTLTDPRPNLGAERDKAAYLGLELEGRLDALAAAELQQAHGRLRTVHREAPGWQLHVGAIVPNGWQGLPVEVRRMPVGRPRNTGTMTGDELRAAREGAEMGLREMARLLGVGHQTLTRYEAGERTIPDDVRRGVLSLTQSGPETPIQNMAKTGVSETPSVQWSATGVSGPPQATGVSGPNLARHPRRVLSADSDEGRRARRIDLETIFGTAEASVVVDWGSA